VSKNCKHIRAREVGHTMVGMGDVYVEWCPTCGALKRTMRNWEMTDWPWEIPGMEIDCTEVCADCGVEIEMESLVQECPECGLLNTACHACQHWEDNEPGPCARCEEGSNFKEKDE